jgi:hypothetical protein
MKNISRLIDFRPDQSPTKSELVGFSNICTNSDFHPSEMTQLKKLQLKLKLPDEIFFHD